ncbi:MAG: hypothetical protein ABSA44_12920 [Bacteroidota bacterium]|jgi:hypothetical protein
MNYRSILCTCFVLLGVSVILAVAGNTQKKEKNITIGLVGKSQSNPVFIAAYCR